MKGDIATLLVGVTMADSVVVMAVALAAANPVDRDNVVVIVVGKVVLAVEIMAAVVTLAGVVELSLSVFVRILVNVMSVAVEAVVVILVVDTAAAEDVIFDGSIVGLSDVKGDIVTLSERLTVAVDVVVVFVGRTAVDAMNMGDVVVDAVIVIVLVVAVVVAVAKTVAVSLTIG